MNTLLPLLITAVLIIIGLAVTLASTQDQLATTRCLLGGNTITICKGIK